MSNAKFQQWQNDVLYSGLLKLRQVDYGDLPCLEVLRELENGIDEIIAAAEVENEDASQFADPLQDAKDALCDVAVEYYLNIDDSVEQEFWSAVTNFNEVRKREA